VVSHEKYLVADTYVRGLPEHDRARLLQSWSGYVDSRLRTFVDKFEYGLPVINVRLLPKKLPLLSDFARADAQGGEGQAYLVGFGIDRDRLQGTEIHVTNRVEAFKEELYAGAIHNGLLNESCTRDNLRLRISQFESWSDMPEEAFGSLGGRELAATTRRKVRRAKRERRARERAEMAAAIEPSYLGNEYVDDDPAFAVQAAPEHAEGVEESSTDGGAAGGATKRAHVEDSTAALPPAKAAKVTATSNDAAPLLRVESSAQDLLETPLPAGGAPPAQGQAGAKIKLTLA